MTGLRKLTDWIKSSPIRIFALMYIAWMLFFCMGMFVDHLLWDVWNCLASILLSLFTTIICLVAYYWQGIPKKVERIIWRGAFTGVISASVGLLAFMLLTLLEVDEFIPNYIVGFFMNATAPTLIPAALGGGLLAFLFYSDTLSCNFTTKSATLLGMALGAAAGIVPCMFFGLILLRRGGVEFFLIHTAEVTFIASLAGGWTARRLIKQVQNKTSAEGKHLLTG